MRCGAAETPASQTEPAADPIAAERERHAADVPESISHEVAKHGETKAEQDAVHAAAAGTQPGGETGESTGGRGALGSDSGRSEPVAGSGGVGVQPRAEHAGGSGASAEGSSNGARKRTDHGDAAQTHKSGRRDHIPPPSSDPTTPGP